MRSWPAPSRPPTGSPRHAAFLILGSVIAVLCLLDAGLLRRPWGITLGWVLQLATLLSALIVPMMLIVALLFLALWVTALVQGTNMDALTRRVDAQWYAEHGSPEQEPGGSPTGGPHPARRIGCRHDRAHPRPDQARRRRRNLTGAILSRIEAKGYTLAELELRTPTRELLARTTPSTRASRSTSRWSSSCSSGPVVAVVFEGHRLIEGFRSLAGATDPTTAPPGTIRGDFGRDWGLKVQQNLVHGSDSPESAEREIRSGSPSSLIPHRRER